MKPKFIVYCLALICLIFSWNGLMVINDVDVMIQTEACYTEDQLNSLREKVDCFQNYKVKKKL